VRRHDRAERSDLTDTPDSLGIAGIVGGALSILTAFAGGIRWLLRRHDRREATLERKEAALVRKLEARVTALEEETRSLWMVIGYVIPALHRHDPLDPALRMASKILGDKFPIDPVAGPDMRTTTTKFD
jgi:hypothetical protein